MFSWANCKIQIKNKKNLFENRVSKMYRIVHVTYNFSYLSLSFRLGLQIFLTS